MQELLEELGHPGIPLSVVSKAAEIQLLDAVDKVLLGNRWLRKATGIQPKFPYLVDSFEERLVDIAAVPITPQRIDLASFLLAFEASRRSPRAVLVVSELRRRSRRWRNRRAPPPTLGAVIATRLIRRSALRSVRSPSSPNAARPVRE